MSSGLESVPREDLLALVGPLQRQTLVTTCHWAGEGTALFSGKHPDTGFSLQIAGTLWTGQVRAGTETIRAAGTVDSVCRAADPASAPPGPLADPGPGRPAVQVTGRRCAPAYPLFRDCRQVLRRPPCPQLVFHRGAQCQQLSVLPVAGHEQYAHREFAHESRGHGQ